MPKVFAKKTHQKEAVKEQDSPEENHDPLKVFLNWQAGARPYREKHYSYYRYLVAIAVLLVLIAFFMREPILAGAILAAAFVAYVLGKVPPEDISYKISTQGVTIGEHFYFWDELDSFWLGEKEGHKVANIFTNLRFPAQLTIPLGSQSEEKFKQIVAQYLPFHEIPPRSFIDHWAAVIQKHFPLETPPAHKS